MAIELWKTGELYAARLTAPHGRGMLWRSGAPVSREELIRMEFRSAIMEALHAGPPFTTSDILDRYRDGGGQQARAYEILMGALHEIREAGVPEDMEDALLDTMDAVVGDIKTVRR